jgi:glycosyltransferase involved in cell wall biosynthesis
VKIVLFGPAYPFRGGIAQFSGVLRQSLVKAGHEVKVVNFRKQFPKLLFPGKTQYDDSPQALKIPSVRTFTLWNPLSWLRTAREIERHDPDLIAVMWWIPFFAPGYWGAAKLLKKQYRSRILYVLHNVIPHERRFGDVFLSRLALNTAHNYLALSQAEEREMRRLFPHVPPERTRYSPHPSYDCYAPFTGNRTQAQEHIGVKAEKLLLFFGFVREYKGLDVLLRAMPEILKDDPQIKLVIAGEFYQNRAQYDALISSLGIGGSVIIHDRYLSGDEVGAYFAAADCVVLPYRSATQSGIVQVAYALDMPVITTNVGGLSEVVTDSVTGYLVPPEDPPAIAEAVRKFYRTGGKPAFTENVSREAQRFSWDALVDTITSFAR